MSEPTWGRYGPDLMGYEVNGAVVIADAGTRYKNPTKFWRLRCKCGNEFEKAAKYIRNHPESIRCQACARKAMGAVNITHGETRTDEYQIWIAMKRRCTHPSHVSYKHYGGRGIRIADEWLNDYPAYAAYVREHLGPRPSPKHSIDRINNDGHYEPGNIRWATPSEQLCNRRKAPSKNPKPKSEKV